MNKILISVLVLSYNHRKYISTCIQSALKQVNSSIGIEVIVIDDGSSDGTIDVLREMENEYVNLKVYYNRHEGVYAISKNINKLIEYANGKYIAFLASDDEYIDNRFDKQLKILEADEETVIVYGNGENYKEGEIIGSVLDEATVNALQSNDPNIVFKFITENLHAMYLQSVLARREFFLNFKPADENMIADDWVFNIRCFNKLIQSEQKYAFVNDSLFLRNILPKNTSSDIVIHSIRILEVIDRYSPAGIKKQFKAKIYLIYAKKAFQEMNLLFAFDNLINYILNDPFLFVLVDKIKSKIWAQKDLKIDNK
jgi:glycosyltransferase involved in cell wall biosynthesis